jgi:hypothetical protein
VQCVIKGFKLQGIGKVGNLRLIVEFMNFELDLDVARGTVAAKRQVFESPVESGLLPFLGETWTATGRFPVKTGPDLAWMVSSLAVVSYSRYSSCYIIIFTAMLGVEHALDEQLNTTRYR